MSKDDLLAGERPVQVARKVLYISPLPPPYYGSAISSEMCLNILRNDERFEVRNVKLNYSLEIFDLGKISFQKIRGVFRVARQVKALLRNFHPHVVYFMPATTGGAMLRDYYFLRIIRRFPKHQLILHLRTQLTDEQWSHPIKKFLLRELVRCDKIIVLGMELVGQINHIVPDGHIHVLPNAIGNSLSDDEFTSIILNRIKNTEINLLFLSNMQEFKGWLRVLETCKLLADADIKFKCHFVGSWPSDYEERRFMTFVAEHGLEESIIYHGQLINKEKNAVLEGADIFIYPTANDACPRVIIEAMEYGLPIISTRTGTIPSLMENGVTGFIVENNNAADLYLQVLKLLNKEVRNEMGRRGRERFLEKFTLDKYKENFVSILLRN